MDMRFKDIPVPEELDRVVEENMKKFMHKKSAESSKGWPPALGLWRRFLFSVFFSLRVIRRWLPNFR